MNNAALNSHTTIVMDRAAAAPRAPTPEARRNETRRDEGSDLRRDDVMCAEL